MNSAQVQEYRDKASEFGNTKSESVNLLAKSVSSYLDALAWMLGGRSWPESDLSSLSISLLLLSDAANEMHSGEQRRSLDYLVAMGFEQSGELLSRQLVKEDALIYSPLENDLWYRLVLSFFHYMAGGFRVQALCVLRHLDTLSQTVESQLQSEYFQLVDALWDYFQGSDRRTSINPSLFNDLIRGKMEPQLTQLADRRIFRLASRFREMKEAALEDLGLGKETIWLSSRNMSADSSISFWKKYLAILSERQYTNFTPEQIGKGFDSWLLPEKNLLVVLPTGSGKTLIGELMTALTLAQGSQAIWMLPTRALVRQTKKELSKAFESLDVDVDELPITEDYIPQIFDQISQQRLVAVSTPEKIAALIRSNKTSVSNVKLVVLDEAQILLENRGTTAEYALQEIRRLCPECKFVLMSAFTDVEERLRSFLKRLVRQDENIVELISYNRPTRRMNGVITSDKTGRYPLISIYPPDLFSEKTEIKVPYRIHFEKIKLGKKNSSIEYAKKVSKKIIGTSLRAVVFVNTVSSCEKQAKTIAGISRKSINLPEYDVYRLRVELGRQSFVETTAQKGVAPHHGSLSGLEQHIVEKWLKERIINLVIATPTLAQGVNLPFDLSIVSFIKRSKQDDPQVQEEVPIPEIMNMLGRAGRAGQVSDGLCLITAPRKEKSDTKLLNYSRKYFFRTGERNHGYLGLAKLLKVALDSKVNEQAWLEELSGMNLDQAQTLVSFAMRSTIELESEQTDIIGQLALFPSIQDLKELFEKNEDLLINLSKNIKPLVENIISVTNNNTSLIRAIARTGLPIEILKYILVSIQENADVRGKSQTELTLWADDIVFAALESCSSRDWYKRFFADILKDFSINQLRTFINLWREGSSIADIEDRLNLSRSVIGKFISRKLSLFAQFWGAIAVCDDELNAEDSRRPFEHIQMCVREGVSSIQELIWLNHLGGLDRVLAHKLALATPMTEISSDRRSISRFVKERLKRWQGKRELIPIALSADEVGALLSIFNER
jgi:superfamily II DNA/RNA helicase